jgi:flagellar basal body L-ring protein FlgH
MKNEITKKRAVIIGATLVLVTVLSACSTKTAQVDESDAYQKNIQKTAPPAAQRTPPPSAEVQQRKDDAMQRIEEKKKKFSGMSDTELFDDSKLDKDFDTLSNKGIVNDSELSF